MCSSQSDLSEQISLRMYKTFQSQADPSKPDQRWLQAAVQAMLMQCRQIKDPQASERSLLLAMVDRNLQSLPPPQTVDEFHLHSQFFGLKGSQAEVEWFKRDDVKKIASQDLGTELKRREVLAAHGSKEDQLSLAEECLSKIDDKNWATISMVISLAMRLENQELLGRTLAKLTELADHPELGKERGYAMGLLLPHQLVKEDPVKSSLKLPGGKRALTMYTLPAKWQRV